MISYLWKQFQNSGTVSRRSGQGRPRATTANEDRYLVLSAKRQRTSTATQLSRDLAAATGTSVSRKTVARRLHETGLYARKLVMCIPLKLLPTKESIYYGAFNINTGRSLNGLMFSSRMSPDSVYSLILGESSYGGNVGPDTIPVTS